MGRPHQLFPLPGSAYCPDLIAGLGGPTSKERRGREREEGRKGREGERKGGKGRGGKGEKGREDDSRTLPTF